MKKIIIVPLCGVLMAGGLSFSQEDSNAIMESPDIALPENTDKKMAENFAKEVNDTISGLCDTLKSIKDKTSAQAELNKIKELNQKIRILENEVGTFKGEAIFGNDSIKGVIKFMDVFDERRRLLLADYYECPGLKQVLDGEFFLNTDKEIDESKITPELAKTAARLLMALNRSCDLLMSVKDKASADAAAKEWSDLNDQITAIEKILEEKKQQDAIVPAIQKYGPDMFLYGLLSLTELGRLEKENYYGSEALKKVKEKIHPGGVEFPIPPQD